MMIQSSLKRYLPLILRAQTALLPNSAPFDFSAVNPLVYVSLFIVVIGSLYVLYRSYRLNQTPASSSVVEPGMESTPTRQSEEKVNGTIGDEPPSPTWRNLLYTDDTGERIQVGEWALEDVGNQRKIKVKPLSPLHEDTSGLLVWLEVHLSDYGTVTISENGDIEITYSDILQPEKLLEQVSYVYHTLQGNEP